jgi:PAS domain S-box-containing protein
MIGNKAVQNDYFTLGGYYENEAIYIPFIGGFMNNIHEAMSRLSGQEFFAKVERFISQFPIGSGLLATLIVICCLEIGHYLGIALPTPLPLLLGTVMLMSAFAGTRAGIASVIVAASFIIYAMLASSSSPLTEDHPLYAFSGILLILVIATILGQLSDQKKNIIQQLQQHQQQLELETKRQAQELLQLKSVLNEQQFQRQTLEENLQAHANLIDSLTQRLREIVFIYQGDQLLYVNQAMLDLTGYHRQELLMTKRLSEIIASEFQQLVQEYPLNPFAEFGKLQQQKYSTIQVVTKDKQIRFLSFTSHLIEYQGKPARIGFAIDNTDAYQAEEILQVIVDHSFTARGEKFFHLLVQYLAHSLHLDFAFVSQVTEHNSQRMKTVAVFAHDQLVDNFEYDLYNTPCEIVTQSKRIQSYAQQIQQRFPLDILLVDMGVDSYIGFPIIDDNLTVMGLMAVMDSKPIAHAKLVALVLRLLSPRVTMEMQRWHTTSSIRTAPLAEYTGERKIVNKNQL